MPHTMKQMLKVTRILRDKCRDKVGVKFRIGGLIFRNEDDYKLLKYIDENVRVLEKCMENFLTDYVYYFCSLPRVRVLQTYKQAWEELYSLFPSVSELVYIVDGNEFKDVNNYQIGSSFFELFIIKDKKSRSIQIPSGAQILKFKLN